MLHAELIGLSGRAPDALAWRRPALMETAAERHAGLGEEVVVNENESGVDLADVDAEAPNVWQRSSMGAAGEQARWAV